MIRIGYPCMNLTLEASTSHRVQLASLQNPERLARAIAANFNDARRILPWNAEHDWRLFRLGSSFIPFASHPRFPYDWLAEHEQELSELAALARRHGQRLSMHPGQYVNPGSPKPEVVERSLSELRYAAQLVHRLDPKEGVVVLHVGGVYGDPAGTAERFAANLKPEREILEHLALENDETSWAPDQVLPMAEKLGVPTIVDTLHHRLNPGSLSLKQAMDWALLTWHGRQKVHISSQAPDKKPGAHAQMIAPADWQDLMEALEDRKADVMVEAKAKEQALPDSINPFR